MHCQTLLVHAVAALLSTTAVAVPVQPAARQADLPVPAGSLPNTTGNAVTAVQDAQPSLIQTVGSALGLGKRQAAGFIDPELLAALLPLLAGGGGGAGATPGQGLQALMNAQQNSGQGRTTTTAGDDEEVEGNSSSSSSSSNNNNNNSINNNSSSSSSSSSSNNNNNSSSGTASNAGGVVEVPAATTRPQRTETPAVIPVGPVDTNATISAANATDAEAGNVRRAEKPAPKPLHAVIGVTRVTE